MAVRCATRPLAVRSALPDAQPLPATGRSALPDAQPLPATGNSPGDPDPSGKRVAVVRRALETQTHIKAFFWECARVPAPF